MSDPPRAQDAYYRPRKDCQVPSLAAIYEAVFGRRSDGTFVEVGAFDGRTVSNTDFLADLGWRGLYVEPVPGFAEMCARNHAANPGVTVVCSAIGSQPGAARIHLGGVLSTARDDVFDHMQGVWWGKMLLKGESVEVSKVRLDALLERHGVAPGFEILVVDVEGSESDVFASFDIGRWRPKVLVIELSDDHPDLQGHAAIVAEHKDLRARLAAAGYATVFRDPINTVLVRMDGSPERRG
ncbi:MAG: FkbM family methyltransferase [Alphaproteobacteria bacterium]|nr:FkbM family methyltransferase [Alphaproteobacteria bacterium]